MLLLTLTIATTLAALPNPCGYCRSYVVDGTTFEVCDHQTTWPYANACWTNSCYSGGMCPEPPKCMPYFDSYCGYVEPPPSANGHQLSTDHISALARVLAEPFVMNAAQRENFWLRVDDRVAGMSPEDAAAETGTMMHLEFWRLYDQSQRDSELYRASLAGRAVRVFERMR